MMLTIQRAKTLGLLLLLATAVISRPAFAQVDLSGEWSQAPAEDNGGAGDPEIGNYTGLPVNDAARMRADTWDAEKWTQLEHECEPHPADYAPRGPGSMRVWADMDPFDMHVTAWHTEIMWMQPKRIIYMDNRPHPSAYAVHTWQGFSTGEWVADMLKVTTTHLKEGWIRRNGLPRSEKATVTEFFIRHEDYFTLVTIVHDPVYLTEPLIRTAHWILDPGYHPIASTCVPTVEIEHPKGWVAYHLPGTNPWLTEFASEYGMPVEAARGGAETMYPEYQKKLATLPKPPKSTENKSAGTK